MAIWKELDHWKYEYFPCDEPASSFSEAEEFVALWHAKRGDRVYPTRQDYDWYDLQQWWGFIGISEYFRDPFDYRYSLFGTRMVERFHYDPTGIKGTEYGPGAYDGGDDLAFFEWLAGSGHIARVSGTIHWQERSHVPASVVILPLSRDGQTVTDSIELLT